MHRSSTSIDRRRISRVVCHYALILKTKATQTTGLGRIQPGSYFWSPTGDSLLFIGSSDLVLLD